MTLQSVATRVAQARREVEGALQAALMLDAAGGTTGRRDMLVGSLAKWLAMSLDGLEAARKAIVEFEIEGGRKP